MSVDGAHDTSIRLALIAVAETAVGIEGAVVSELPEAVVAETALVWAEALPAPSMALTV